MRVGSGAALSLSGGCTMRGNTAGTRGAALGVYSDAVAHVTDTIMEANAVLIPRSRCTMFPCGGAVAVQDLSLLVVGSGTEIRDNEADFGAGIMVSESGVVQIAGLGVVVSGNVAQDGGGVATVNTSKLEIDGSLLLENNVARRSAGALFSSGLGVALRGQTSMVCAR
jgi:hypothetical protein